MSLMQVELQSKVLNSIVPVNVCLPDLKFGMTRTPGAKYQVLYLLHGGGGDASDWIRKTSIERYATDHQIIVVCPAAYNSFYADMAHGDRYYTYITEELPELIAYLFPISTKREDTFVAGLSMGGHGASKWATNKPEFMAAVGCFSAAVNMPSILRTNHMKDGKLTDHNLFLAFDCVEKIDNTADDVIYMSKKNFDKGLPPFYLDVGTEDFTYAFNTHFRDYLQELGASVTWFECPGSHEWGYWDAAVQRFLNWAPLKNAPIVNKEGE